MNRRVTTQDISWFLDLNRNDQLDLDPPYQRRSVWTPKDRRFFLDTVFRGYPSPSIFLHKVSDGGNTIYRVVDGKQRLETILLFISNKLSIDKEFGDIRLSGKKWKDISKDQDLAKAFWDYVLPVEFINVDVSSNFVNEVFDRLNRNSRKLVEQELRHAKYDGWFITFVEREAEELEWKELGVVTTSRAKRMKDVQFLSELLIVILKGDISGFDQNEIDDFSANYDDPSEISPEVDVDAMTELFTKTRRYMVSMENHNQCVTNYASDFKNFYTLWALIATRHILMTSPNDLADSYVDFMAEVNAFKDPSVYEKAVRGEVTTKFKSSYRYYQGSIGASTEEPQRRDRLEALLELVQQNESA
ncbi:DUF262 domain-containing protein [Geomonas nitrogeniifigens]|uniref:DUF262 domain-containing protein n=1 Tax=Geomonas diazotrophica TaxID=2843197 RepID=UPI001C2CA0EE|nr:DUF262 domain-containing protein [Geomonas nitrogeniifigens]QXE86376.1 DUF262 domain-containing protein [Geomonas nitrogeniifigens]